ncbi:MAG: MBL fold metallo-hydrolase [Oscillospiraceae bacterium]|nr:MBL fold metallo-hydrolase [Oscillospiraceae bacterium]
MPRFNRRRPRGGLALLLAGIVIAACAAVSFDKRGGSDYLESITDAVRGFDARAVISLIFPGDKEISANSGAIPAMSGTPGAEVHFIDVGQGKAVLIISEGEAALIDCGDTGKGAQVAGYLRRQGISKISILAASHPHADHIGDMDKLVEEFEVGIFIMPDLPDALIPTTRTFTRLLSALDEKGLQITIAKPGEVFPLGGGALRILGPVGEYDNLNDMSVICRFEYGEVSFLFTGDAEEAAEEAAAERYHRRGLLRADVLDVGHHGSKSSTSQNFLDLVNPRIAVISCGMDNGYGHPAREALERLSGAEVYRTDIHGTVVIKTDGLGITVQQS